MAVKRVLPVAIGMAVVALLIAVLILFSSSAPPPAVTVVAPAPESASEPQPPAPERVALTTLEGVVEGESESAVTQTSEERQRAQFIRNVRAGDMRMRLGEGVPIHVVRLFGAGKLREGVEILLRMGREGDPNGYLALGRIVSDCPGPGGDRDFERSADAHKLRNDAMIEAARMRGTPALILKQLRWSLDAGNANRRGIWAEFCPGPGEGDGEAILDEVRAVFPGVVSSEMRARLATMPTEERQRAMAEMRAKSADQIAEARRDSPRTLTSEVAAAAGQLHSNDMEKRRAAFEKLLELAEVSVQAKLSLAICLRSQCVPDAGGGEEALALYLEAARGGSIEAMQALSRRDTTDPFSARPRANLDLSTAERYGWYAVREELIASGCYGMDRFAGWGFAQTRNSTSPLMALSPTDATAAEARAREMTATEVPAIRAAIGCD